MERKIVKHGNHIVNNDKDGYMYNLNYSDAYNFSSHMHSCYEFLHIINGNLIYNVEGREYMLLDGDMVITKPEEFHSFAFPNQGFYYREFFHIYPDFFKSFPELLEFLNSRQNGKLNRIPAELVKKYGINEIFRRMAEACEKRDSNTDLMMLAYAVELVVQIKRIMEVEIIQYMPPVSNEKSANIRNYIDQHFGENITVPQIAEAVFMSTAYACRLFKKETGMTIKAYLNLRRITSAKNLIMEGRKTTEVFEKCGFLDYSTFYRAFVKFVGIPPEKFKNTYKP